MDILIVDNLRKFGVDFQTKCIPGVIAVVPPQIAAQVDRKLVQVIFALLPVAVADERIGRGIPNPVGITGHAEQLQCQLS